MQKECKPSIKKKTHKQHPTKRKSGNLYFNIINYLCLCL